jgi:hypothetical protein
MQELTSPGTSQSGGDQRDNPIKARWTRRSREKKECQRRRGPNRKSMEEGGGTASWLGRKKLGRRLR